MLKRRCQQCQEIFEIKTEQDNTIKYGCRITDRIRKVLDNNIICPKCKRSNRIVINSQKK